MSIDSSSKLKQLSNEEVREKIAKYKKYIQISLVFYVVYSLIPLCLELYAPEKFKDMFIYHLICMLHYMVGSMTTAGIIGSINLIKAHQCIYVTEDVLSELKGFWWKTVTLFTVFVLLAKFDHDLAISMFNKG